MRFLIVTIAALSLASSLAATESEETPEAKAEREARVKANLAEHAERRATKDSAKDEPRPEPATEAQPEATVADDPALLLPEYRVSSSRISELDIEIKKLNRDIDRAKKKLKPSELDETLNSDAAPKLLAIFGGKTAGQRKSVAAERVDLMEAERDILEAMKHVRTKKEEAVLKEQLNTFKTMRRQLDDVLH